MEKRFYVVGGHCFMVEADTLLFNNMRSYQPFLSQQSGKVVFSITLKESSNDSDVVFTPNNQWENDYLSSVSGYTADGRSVFKYGWSHKLMVTLITSSHYREATAYLTGYETNLGIDMAMMVLFSQATAHLKTTIIHSSAICFQQHAYLFIGISGTGKSTHSQLWLNYIPGTEMINDDKPVIRIQDNGEVWLYGSPWSGKKACYRNVSYPVGAIVKLKQAPYNRISRLDHIEAYLALLHCIYGKRWEKSIGDALHLMESKLVERIPIWNLECLPNEEAAKLCKETITQ